MCCVLGSEHFKRDMMDLNHLEHVHDASDKIQMCFNQQTVSWFHVFCFKDDYIYNNYIVCFNHQNTLLIMPLKSFML